LNLQLFPFSCDHCYTKREATERAQRVALFVSGVAPILISPKTNQSNVYLLKYKQMRN